MLENKDIDNLFKSAIEPYEMEPTDKVWTSLDAELAKKQMAGSAKKGNGLKYLSIIAGLMLLSFAAYQILAPSSYINNTSDKKKDEVSQANEMASANSSTIDERVKTFFGNKTDNASKGTASKEANNDEAVNQLSHNGNNSSLVQNNSADNQETKNINSDQGSGLNSNQNKRADNLVASTASKGAYDNVANQQTETASAATSNSTTSSENTSGEDAGNANTFNTNSTNNHSDATQPSTQTENKNENDGVSSSHATNEETGTTQSSTSAETKNLPAASSQPQSDMAAISSNQSVNGNADERKENPQSANSSTANAQQDNTAVIHAIPLNQLKPRFSLDAFYSPGIISGATQNNSNNTQSAATTTSQQFNYSYNTGALLRFDFSDRWSVALGCTYSTLDYSTSVSTRYRVPPADSGHGGGGQWHFPHGDDDTTFSHNFNDHNFFNHYFPYSPSDNSFDFNNSCGNILTLPIREPILITVVYPNL